MTTVGLIDPDRAAVLLDARDLSVFSERLLDAAHSAAGVGVAGRRWPSTETRLRGPHTERSDRRSVSM